MMMPKALMTMNEETTPQEGHSGGPRAERPRRRTFTPAEKLAHIEAYEEAITREEGGAPMSPVKQLLILVDRRGIRRGAWRT